MEIYELRFKVIELIKSSKEYQEICELFVKHTMDGCGIFDYNISCYETGMLLFRYFKYINKYNVDLNYNFDTKSYFLRFSWDVDSVFEA